MENNLEKEFVPNQEALELKKLGFNEPCFGFYERSKELVIQECEITDFHFDSLQCVAPTFSQAFRFFRENYTLPSNLELLHDGWDYVIYLDITEEIDFYEGPWNTYEEAELACIKRLIKIANELE